ncbi:MAG: signal peptidase I [Propioniciclava sp.]|uniref:signal peptidase I n=1 Tax=Propioniciclava sp. TaxID=2038686 RepID=UPI0039E56AB6
MVAVFVVLAIVQAFAVKAFQVPSSSMEPVLKPGDRALVNRTAYMSGAPVVGDIVAFTWPEDWPSQPSERGALRTVIGWVGDIVGFGPSNTDVLVKRVLAGPGDTVECCDDLGHLLRNGQQASEPFLGSDLPFVSGQLDCTTSPRSTRCFPMITVPDDHYLMVGDNRARSSDSVTLCRGADAAAASDCARLVSRQRIIGKVFFVVFPFDRWGAPK